MPTITLETLTCIRDGDLWGRAEPYMWNFYFGLGSPPIEDPAVAPGDNLKVATSDPLLYTPASGRHGNLGVTKVGRGQTINIPPPIGKMTIPLKDPKIGSTGGGPTSNWASIGVISMLLEQDWCSNSGVMAGYVAMRMLIESQLKHMINNKMDQPVGRPAFQPLDVQNALSPLMRSGKFPGQVMASVMGAQSLLQNIASFLRPDDVIGMQVFMWDMRQLTPPPAEIEFFGSYSQRGHWEVRGRVSNP
ncbi:hypothetical protein [Enhygromyxa salina]|uniref:Uncharacterized protein n=1 Tax=Enhygromyxa salina TaxID=215803 RepID=A0A2S9YP74_9BACT|nr:hypothetical protein [Enhygromyxa salina]PRQ06878.1 hypothetical protein ENSA7_34160 [Enhygromyxa salina]